MNSLYLEGLTTTPTKTPIFLSIYQNVGNNTSPKLVHFNYQYNNIEPKNSCGDIQITENNIENNSFIKDIKNKVLSNSKYYGFYLKRKDDKNYKCYYITSPVVSGQLSVDNKSDIWMRGQESDPDKYNNTL
jgi:hypothetical protein